MRPAAYARSYPFPFFDWHKKRKLSGGGGYLSNNYNQQNILPNPPSPPPLGLPRPLPRPGAGAQSVPTHCEKPAM